MFEQELQDMLSHQVENKFSLEFEELKNQEELLEGNNNSTCISNSFELEP